MDGMGMGAYVVVVVVVVTTLQDTREDGTDEGGDYTYVVVFTDGAR